VAVDKFVRPSDIPIDIPEGKWRLGKQHDKAIVALFPTYQGPNTAKVKSRYQVKIAVPSLISKKRLRFIQEAIHDFGIAP
jgi:hypothetical protein